MFKRILLPFDGLKQTMTSARFAISLAKLLNARLFVVHIITDTASKSAGKNCPGKEVRARCRKRLQGMFRQVEEEAGSQGFKGCSCELRFSKEVITGIRAAVSEFGADLCVLQPSPYHRTGLVSDACRMISKSLSIPMLYVKSGARLEKGSRILVPIDEHPGIPALAPAISLAKTASGSLIFYHTTWRNPDVKSPDPYDHCVQAAKDNLGMAEQQARAQGIPFRRCLEMTQTIEEGIILCAIQNQAELVCMAYSRSIVGGKPDLVLNLSMCPLLVVKT